MPLSDNAEVAHVVDAHAGGRAAARPHQGTSPADRHVSRLPGLTAAYAFRDERGAWHGELRHHRPSGNSSAPHAATTPSRSRPPPASSPLPTPCWTTSATPSTPSTATRVRTNLSQVRAGRGLVPLAGQGLATSPGESRGN